MELIAAPPEYLCLIVHYQIVAVSATDLHNPPDFSHVSHKRQSLRPFLLVRGVKCIMP